MRSNREKGQVILLLLVVMAIVLLGAIGLAIDVSQLYAHQQMAQVAADAAAQAAMMSIFQGVNNVTANPSTYFTTSGPFTCGGATDQRTPCQYARMNGFGNDIVTVSFPACTSYPNATCAPLTPNEVQVTITRQVSNGFIRMLGAGSLNSIGATGIAGTFEVVSPVPILILHPTLPGSFIGDSNTTITIKGGPSKSIQVNSSATDAVGLNNKFPLVDLLQAYNGTGADFGAFGGPATEPGTFQLGTGTYRQPAGPTPDPLLPIDPPSATEIAALATRTGAVSATAATLTALGCGTAPLTAPCSLYEPGIYPNGLNIKTKSAIFQPGLYVMQNDNGFAANNSVLYICGGIRASLNALDFKEGCKEDTVTGDGMLVYNQNDNNTGGGLFHITGNSEAYLQGTPAYTLDALGNAVPKRYAGILFFQDRTSADHSGPGVSNLHQIGGGGTMELQGTIYATNTVDTIANSGKYQKIVYNGGPCTNTFLIGMIITDALQLNGGGCINMTLESQAFLKLRQIALIGGGPHF